MQAPPSPERFRHQNFGAGLGFGSTSFYPQAGGDAHPPSVELTLYADHYYTLFEDTRGYTAVYNPDNGLWSYARLDDDGHFIPGPPLDAEPPADIPRKLRENPDYVRKKIEKLTALEKAKDKALLALEYQVSPPTPDRTFGGDNGLLTGPKIFDGTVKGLTVLVEFSDETFLSTLRITGEQLRKEVDQLFNADEKYTGYGNFSSVNGYYKLMSSGELDYTNQIVGPITLRGKKSQYVAQLDIVGEVLQALQAMEDNGTIHPKDFDYKNRNLVSAFNILYAGQAVFKGNLWPHNSAYVYDNGTPAFTFHKSKMGVYYYLLTDLSEIVIGTICHENGHLLFRFPDLYSYGNRDGENRPYNSSAGIGKYCLMGAGNYNNNRRGPCPVSGYLRELAGWVKKEVVLNNLQGKDITIPHGDYSTIYKWKHPSGDNHDEYFIVENKQKHGLEAFLPSHGLAVYHCDRKGSNEWVEGTKEKHFQLALLQADGQLDLEYGKNQGDAQDLYRPGKSLNDATTPSTRLWGNAKSGFSISNIRFNSDKSITFTVGPSHSLEAHAPAPPKVIHKSQTPKVLIPDDFALGITDHVTIEDAGFVKQAIVNVNILHSRVKDLYVALISPSGKQVVLHNRKALDKPNLRVSYDVSKYFTAEEAQGHWVLEVADVGHEEEGYLQAWGLELHIQEHGL